MRRLSLLLTLCAAVFAAVASPATAAAADPCDQYPSGTYAHADCMAQHEWH
ncbi:hypothetical protein [Streptomyces sp. NPDC051572]|uniref:hypothetical protein n=1 Tax=unclassified Streptomyces TaxID=2593676 RepID=UPI003450CF73|nr:hypothetical protein OG496_06805 [Streptomyces sp. NBC_00988]